MMKLTYFDPVKNWRRIKRHIHNEELQQILYDDFSDYLDNRGHPMPYVYGVSVPADFESVDWRCDRGRGRPPKYWDYVRHGACHWLVNFNLKLAMLVEPCRPWRILTSDKHSTVFDGEGVLFDFNMKALSVPVAEAYTLATTAPGAKELAPGELWYGYDEDELAALAPYREAEDREQERKRKESQRKIAERMAALGVALPSAPASGGDR